MNRQQREERRTLRASCVSEVEPVSEVWFAWLRDTDDVETDLAVYNALQDFLCEKYGYAVAVGPIETVLTEKEKEYVIARYDVRGKIDDYKMSASDWKKVGLSSSDDPGISKNRVELFEESKLASNSKDVRTAALEDLSEEHQKDIVEIAKTLEQSSNGAVAFGTSILDRLGMTVEAQTLREANESIVGATYDELIAQTEDEDEKKRLAKLKRKNAWPEESWLLHYIGARKLASKTSSKLHGNRREAIRFIDELLKYVDANKVQKLWSENR